MIGGAVLAGLILIMSASKGPVNTKIGLIWLPKIEREHHYVTRWEFSFHLSPYNNHVHP